MGWFSRNGSPTWTAVLVPLIVGVICLAASIAMLVQGEKLVAVLLFLFAVCDFMVVSSDLKYLMGMRSSDTDSDTP